MNRSLINFHNQKGAGPKNIAINFINELCSLDSDKKFIFIVPDITDYQSFNSKNNIQFITLPCYKNILMKGVFRMYLELILIPFLVRKNNIKSILAFGNFLFSPAQCKKTVLLHHPYLVDDQLFNNLGFKSRFSETLKRIAFFLTTKNIDTVVVQSDYMKSQLEKKYPNRKYSIEIIPNPISKSFANTVKSFEQIHLRAISISQPLDLLYVSRFYPHKNHRFLTDLSKSLNHQKIDHRILVTVDPSITEADNFLSTIADDDVSIVNLTELEQIGLIEHYRNADLFIFPSKAETFGNPLIEAMCFALPIIVPDLPYARSVVGNAGIYYEENNVQDAVEHIKQLLTDPAIYREKSEDSFRQYDKYPTAQEWCAHYLKVAFFDD